MQIIEIYKSIKQFAELFQFRNLKQTKKTSELFYLKIKRRIVTKQEKNAFSLRAFSVTQSDKYDLSNCTHSKVINQVIRPTICTLFMYFTVKMSYTFLLFLIPPTNAHKCLLQ